MRTVGNTGSGLFEPVARATEFANTDAHEKLVAAVEAAQAKLEADDPRLLVTDEEFNAVKKAAREEANNSHPAFKKASDARAAVLRAQQDFLLTVDK